MNVRSAFEANTKTTETMEPRMSPFDDPTKLAQAAAVFGAALAMTGLMPRSRSRRRCESES